jgi:hypothetical protein
LDTEHREQHLLYTTSAVVKYMADKIQFMDEDVLVAIKATNEHKINMIQMVDSFCLFNMRVKIWVFEDM